MHSLPVVISEEMRRLEKSKDSASLMQKAGSAIAEYVSGFLSPEAPLVILVGKGNKGGDALFAAIKLIQKNYKPLIFCLFPKKELSALSLTHYETLLKKKYPLHTVKKASDITCPPSSLILDGLLGTGCSGPAKGLIAEVIDYINGKHLPLIAIDLPSGLHADTGEGERIFKASVTLAVGLPKLGCFINKGFCASGVIHCLDIGLVSEDIKNLKVSAHLLDKTYLSKLLPPIQRDRHKYQAGYVLSVAGSKMFSGAAELCSIATLRSGAGIVSLFCNAPVPNLSREIIQRPLNTLFEEMPRAQALLIGPGLGRDAKIQKQLSTILKKSSLKTVIDADGLYFLAKRPTFSIKAHLPVLTPHLGEMLSLLKRKTPFANTKMLLSAVQEYTDKKKVIIVLKGAPTWIFSPENIPFVSSFGDPGMATAGSGDVLTGMIAGFLAQKCAPLGAALLAVGLHGLAGEYAALSKTSYCLIASDILEALPEAFQEVLGC